MTTPPKYLGKTGRIADMLWRQIHKLKTSHDPIERRYMFTGPPGLAKTELAEYLAAALTGESFDRIHARLAVNVELLNGQSCSIEVVRKWQETGHYRPLFGDCRVQLVDEIDGMGASALNEVRSYLDRLPPGTVFLATTNKEPKDLQEQLQSRFKVCYFTPPTEEEIYDWLVTLHGLPADFAKRTVKGCKGNVRAAKTDAISWKEAQL